MSKVPSELSYTDSHEWMKGEDGIYKVGITDHAQKTLSEFVYIDLPEIGRKVKKGDVCCTVESVKAASDVYAPISGVIQSINSELAQSPSDVNKDPYGKGWLFTIAASEVAEVSGLLSSEEYSKLIGGE